VYDGVKEKHSRTKAIILEKEKYKSEMEIAIKKNKEKVDEIFIKEEELKKLSDNYVVLSKKLELVKATREKLRDIPPEIAKNLLIAINNSANRYHNEIVGASTLEIDENYDVLLSDSNGTRGYKNLSGGEKMTASVAIRMAFLNEITNIKFLALDEPTASVDNVRKHLLSDIITKVKGISQLFIITHDDVFIPQSNNIIEVIP
jgi:exonuclease SbcC